jgi:glutathione S-transferase
MLQYISPSDLISRKGLRIVLVQGMPSPWGQAAKTIFEVKGLDYVAAPWVVGGENHDIVAWGGERSAPIVAWADEKPIHRWMDILYLAERLSPSPPLIPEDAAQRVLMIGLSNEICGELGIGWNRRLQILSPMMEDGNPAEGIVRMAGKYRYNTADQRIAGKRIAESLRVLAAQLRTQYARGVRFFVGDALSALDIYWAAFMNLMDPLPKEQCPMPEEWRPAFVVGDPQVKATLDPILVEHRDAVFKNYFRSPMEF